MKKLIHALSAIILILILLVGCQKSSVNKTEDNSLDSEGSSILEEIDFTKNDSDMFTDRDLKKSYDENNSIPILLNDNSSSADSGSVKISGDTITITEEGTYTVSGKLSDGMIIVDAPDTAKVQIVFNNVNISCSSSSPLYILQADKVFLTLTEGSENVLSCTGSFVAIDENNIDAVIFSKQDLTVNGTGSLSVNSPSGHGIVSKDDLVITGGNLNITSSSHGLDANDSIRITGTSISIDSGKDGIHAENEDDSSLGFVYISGGTINIKSDGDGISAGAYLQIEDGDINVLSGGGSENGTKSPLGSYDDFTGGRPGRFSPNSQSTSENTVSTKGIKAQTGICIKDGAFTIDSSDDAIHSNTSVIINGGTFEICSGDDGIHADSSLTVTTGIINITESYEGMEALNISVQGGDIRLTATDDGLNATSGTSSGQGLTQGGMFGGHNGGFDKNSGKNPGRPNMGSPGGSESSNGSIIISGGNLYIRASGDGIDANGTLSITGGYTVVVGPTQGDTATLDYDVSGSITGGTFIGTGASGMAQTFSNSEQGVIFLNVGNRRAGTQIKLTDKDGSEIVSYSPELSFQIVIISSPLLISGETYNITIGSDTGDVITD